MIDPTTAPPTAPEDRGTLTVADQVIEKVATAAAREVDQVADQQSRWQKVTRRSLPRATATVAGGHSRIGVQIATPWPASVADVAARTRDHVKERVATLTGTDVIAVDVAVSQVIRPSGPAGGSRGRLT